MRTAQFESPPAAAWPARLVEAVELTKSAAVPSSDLDLYHGLHLCRDLELYPFLLPCLVLFLAHPSFLGRAGIVLDTKSRRGLLVERPW
jgi:hypothetical protein